MHFNSHPHEEDDFRACLDGRREDISTHILTKRMTNVWNNTCEIEDISTHILTKRMTFVLISVFTVVFVISTHILTKRMTLPE